MDNKQIDAAVAKLLYVIKNEPCIVWVGSGLSATADKPGWSRFISDLCKCCGVDNEGMSQSSDSSVFLDKAQECKDRGEIQYKKFIIEKYGVRQGGKSNTIYLQLLNFPFVAHITTNFDPLFIDMARYAPDIEPPIKYWYPNLPPIISKKAKETDIKKYPKLFYYLHGLADDKNDCELQQFVLSRNEFDKAYGKNGPTRNFLYNAFCYLPHLIIFIGTRLQDDYIKDVLKECQLQLENIKNTNQKAARDNKKIGCILIEPSEVEEFDRASQRFIKRKQTREEFNDECEKLKNLNIEVIQYSAETSTYDELLAIIEALRTKYKASESVREASESARFDVFSEAERP